MSHINTIVLYGLPCSGKSSIVKGLPDFRSISVDAIITKIVVDPALDDFDRLSGEIVETIIKELTSGPSVDTVIEMGCLIKKQAIQQLTQYLLESDSVCFNIKLIADDDELVRRIIRRNEAIDCASGNGIKVDGPDYLTRFKTVFQANCPNNFIELDTTFKSPSEVLDAIKQLM